jgi:glutathione synthase/RimK-type ligase-like ATP-grasp enzyme
MKLLFVVDDPDDWSADLPGSATLAARSYLTDPSSALVEAQVINLCRTDRYQGSGYYVSLLAEARGHRPLPDVTTIEDLQAAAQAVLLGEALAACTERELTELDAQTVTLCAYFGEDPEARHPLLAQQLFQLLRAPLLHARFERTHDAWRLAEVRALAAADLPHAHAEALRRAAASYASGRREPRVHDRARSDPAVAILCDRSEADPPSCARALQGFVEAAADVGLRAEIVGAADIDRLPAFDGLFIRATTHVDHYTYEFSRRAAALGLVVIDDPESIVRCTNKVYLHELMTRHQIPTPRTIAVHADNLDQVVPALGLPCILKQPDSAFSLGVARIDTAEAFHRRACELLARSELLIAQAWLPSRFDWRVCVLDRRPLFVCRYHMAPGHWQVIKRDAAQRCEGAVDTLSVAEAPESVVNTAVKAANLIGDGLYGVDLKEVDDQCYLIEVNDNPNIDAGNEDRVLKDALYREVMGVFARRIGESRRVSRTGTGP